MKVRGSWMREDEHLRGVLIGPSGSEEDTYVVLFPYTKQGIREIRPGVLAGAASFSYEDMRPSYTVLEITQVTPVHYALGETADETKRAYPGFRVEAAKAAASDWEQTEPVEETTKIKAAAVSTGWRISKAEEGWVVEEEDIGPMPGSDVILLTREGMDSIINRGLSDETSVSPARLLSASDVPLRLRPKELIAKHFGVFGFTGSGKSNLVSTLVRHMIRSSQDVRGMEGLRVAIVDYMSEYFPLLADMFLEVDKAELVYLDSSSLPRTSADVISSLSGASSEHAEEVAELLLDNMVMPEEIERGGDEAKKALITTLSRAIQKGQVKVLSETSLASLVSSRLENFWREIEEDKDMMRWLGNAKDPLERLIQNISSLGPEDCTVGLVRQLAAEAEKWARDGSMPNMIPPTDSERRPHRTSQAMRPLETFDSKDPHLAGRAVEDRWGAAERLLESSGNVNNISEKAKQSLIKLAETLRAAADQWEKFGEKLGRAAVTVDDIVSEFNSDDSKPHLVIALSDRPDLLRSFFAELAMKLYSRRKAKGQNRPLCLLVVDEADEFISTGGEDYKLTKNAAEVIARRGRKLGIGLGIATQRAAYIDTKVMGQLHTYFVSKLPREHDRKTVAEAYGVPRSYVDRALSLSPGQWLIMSHSATSIKAKPLLAQFENSATKALEALSQWLQGE